VVDVEKTEETMTNEIVVPGYRDHGKLKSQKGPTSMFACQLCKQEGHWVSRCPLLQQAALLVAPTMAPALPAVPKDGPRAYATRMSDGGDDDDDGDDNDDSSFGGEYMPLVALAGVRGGPGRNENHPGPRGGNEESRNQRSTSTGSSGSNGDQRHLDFGLPPPRVATYRT
jgi:hypothetical protein